MAAFVHVLLSVAALATMATAIASVSPEDPDVVKAANFAVSAYNQKQNNAFAYKLVSVQSVSAEMYPPARVKYSLWATVGLTVCRNRPDLHLPDCSLQNSVHGQMTCSFVVLAVRNSDMPSHLLTDRCQ